ncbi:hypothetical protein AAG570_012522 [Ranatra chinensis]|uniref:Uncharacterized protein n=1 Tax=Ranatra chinensis TaxID=642074 RepID=A0ABD0YSS6_9HEMI
MDGHSMEFFPPLPPPYHLGPPLRRLILSTLTSDLAGGLRAPPYRSVRRRGTSVASVTGVIAHSARTCCNILQMIIPYMLVNTSVGRRGWTARRCAPATVASKKSVSCSGTFRMDSIAKPDTVSASSVTCTDVGGAAIPQALGHEHTLSQVPQTQLEFPISPHFYTRLSAKFR